ncbi:MAG TPA: hypothetical protein VNL74_01080 [Methylococcus sp.]|nr:hypothetical protein [Methylococcus sp.]
MNRIKHQIDYRSARRKEYERFPLGDQLDAIWKGFAALRDVGIILPQETLDWLSGIEAVKKKIPKKIGDQSA